MSGMARRWNHLGTSRIVLTGLWADAALVMAASAWNGGLAFEALGQHRGEGIALGVAVDVGLAVSLVGDRALHLHGKSSAWGRALRITTALMSLALNCGVAIWQRHYGVALFHAFLPILLVLLSEYAQDTTLKYNEIADDHAAAEKARRDAELLADRAKWEAEQPARTAPLVTVPVAPVPPAAPPRFTPAGRPDPAPIERADPRADPPRGEDPSATDEELIGQLRDMADKNGGKPPSQYAARQVLGVGGTRAARLLAQMDATNGSAGGRPPPRHDQH